MDVLTALGLPRQITSCTNFVLRTSKQNLFLHAKIIHPVWKNRNNLICCHATFKVDEILCYTHYIYLYTIIVLNILKLFHEILSWISWTMLSNCCIFSSICDMFFLMVSFCEFNVVMIWSAIGSHLLASIPILFLKKNVSY